jgi:hypothetical protein
MRDYPYWGGMTDTRELPACQIGAPIHEDAAWLAEIRIPEPYGYRSGPSRMFPTWREAFDWGHDRLAEMRAAP